MIVSYMWMMVFSFHMLSFLVSLFIFISHFILIIWLMSFTALKCIIQGRRVCQKLQKTWTDSPELDTASFTHLQQSVESHPNYSGPQFTHVEDDAKGHWCVIIVSNLTHVFCRSCRIPNSLSCSSMVTCPDKWCMK